MLKTKTIFFSVIFALSAVYVYAQSNTNRAVTIPQKNTLSSGYGSVVQSFGLSRDKTHELLKIVNPSVRQAIANASKGQCPAVFSVKGTDAKVEHAKQCGRDQEEKKKRNGNPCKPTGVFGSKVEAMCLNGCCVAISVTPGTGSPSGANNLFKGDTGSQGLGSNGNLGGVLGQILGSLFQGMGGSGGSDSSYGYDPYSSYDWDFSQRDTAVDTANMDNTFYENDYTQDIVDNNDFQNTNEPEQEAPAQTSKKTDTPDDSVTTVISANGQKVEIKRTKTKDERFAFVYGGEAAPPADSGMHQERQNDTPAEEVQINENLALRQYINDSEKPETGDFASTGFKGEKVTQPKEPGFFAKLAAWLKSLMGLE